jgi:hypothetical protein
MGVLPLDNHSCFDATLALICSQDKQPKKFRVRLRPNRQAAGRHRQGDRGLHPPAQGGGAELLRPLPVSTRKNRRRSPSTRCGSSTTASAARPRATCSALSARSRTSASRRRCASSRRSAAFRCPSASSPRRKKPPKRASAASCWSCTRPRPPGLKSSCAAEGAVAREYLAGRGLTPEGIKTFRIGYAPDSFNALRDRLSGMADAKPCGPAASSAQKEQGDGTPGPDLRPLPQARHVSHRQRERPGDRLHRPHARDRRQGRAEVHQLAGDAALLEEPGAVQSRQGPHRHPPGRVCPARRRPDGLHLRLSARDTERHRHQRHGLYRAAGGLLRRHTTNVLWSTSTPTPAGSNAAEKSIALLTEEGFTIKLITLDGGLDPDRFIRERGVEAYIAAIRGARSQADYLIERARQLSPAPAPSRRSRP